MSVMGMKPTFVDRDGYRGWMKLWGRAYAVLSTNIRTKKENVKNGQRGDPLSAEVRRAQKALSFERSTGRKMMTLRQEAVDRWTRIRAMHASIGEQNAQFPIDLGNCKRLDFSFNKIAIEFTQMPSWVIRVKGKTFYVKDVISTVGFSTRNKAEGNTRGLLRFPEGHIVIDAEGIAHISPVEKMVDRIGIAA